LNTLRHTVCNFAAKCIETKCYAASLKKKLKNNISLSEPVGIDKEGNELPSELINKNRRRGGLMQLKTIY
jgi:hypothetical protein